MAIEKTGSIRGVSGVDRVGPHEERLRGSFGGPIP